ncbi:hypothetical protein BJ508DRAFT_321994 [Ascobolus immersus RN42]|uniref:Peptidase A1 domain-containing protein n=1 Tax=Ascobolus immersus RN42 TaxID=1160509 RepID=A0A3N4IJL3_ASCIM|nr:hypothetical protein BJ508DRAFT_321994 [Ascobolus immersus RN42]
MEIRRNRWLSIVLAFTLGTKLARGESELALFNLKLFNDSKAPTIQDGLAYGVPLQVGSQKQDVMVLPTFYLPKVDDMSVLSRGKFGYPVLYLPGMKTCEWLSDDPLGTNPKNWNKFSVPKGGDFISTAKKEDEKDSGTITIKWTPSNEPSNLKLMLRRGAGNVTVINDDIVNDGEFVWNATETFWERGLKSSQDYQLMLYTDNPPKASFSGQFALGDKGDTMLVTSSDDKSIAAQTLCEQYISSHGGLYNVTADQNFTEGTKIHDNIRNQNTTWQAFVTKRGTTSIGVSQEPTSAGKFTSTFEVPDVPFAQVKNISVGVGVIGLSDFQKQRNMRSFPDGDDSQAQTNVVGLFIGTHRKAGQVTLGGYDRYLVDFDHGGQFNRFGDEFYVELRSIKVVRNSNGPDAVVPNELIKSKDVVGKVKYSSREAILLEYAARGMRLPAPVLKGLLPLIGSPKYSKIVKGYIYPPDYKVDWALVFDITNGTHNVPITIPGESLFLEETRDNNPLTDRIEAAVRYLALGTTPTGTEKGAYLGRSFLRYCYVVDDSTKRRFHLSQVNETSLEIDPILGSFGLLTEDPFVEKKKERNIGPIIGGVLGGVAVLVVLFCCLFFVMRRNGRRRDDFYPSGLDTNNESRAGDDYGGGRVRGLQALGQGEYKLNIPEAAAHRDYKYTGDGYNDIGGFPLPPNINHPPPSFRTHSPVVSVSSREVRHPNDGSTSPYNFQHVRNLAQQPYGPPSPNTAAADRILSLTNSPPNRRPTNRSNDSRATNSTNILRESPTMQDRPSGGGLTRQASVARSAKPAQITLSPRRSSSRQRFRSESESRLTLPLQSPTLGLEEANVRGASNPQKTDVNYFEGIHRRANSDHVRPHDSILPLPSTRMNPNNGVYKAPSQPPAAHIDDRPQGGLAPRPQKTSPSTSLDTERTSVYGLSNARDDGSYTLGHKQSQPEFFEEASSTESLTFSAPSLGGLGVGSWRGVDSLRASMDARSARADSDVMGRNSMHMQADSEVLGRHSMAFGDREGRDSEVMGRASSHLGYP